MFLIVCLFRFVCLLLQEGLPDPEVIWERIMRRRTFIPNKAQINMVRLQCKSVSPFFGHRSFMLSARLPHTPHLDSECLIFPVFVVFAPLAPSFVPHWLVGGPLVSLATCRRWCTRNQLQTSLALVAIHDFFRCVSHNLKVALPFGSGTSREVHCPTALLHNTLAVQLCRCSLRLSRPVVLR